VTSEQRLNEVSDVFTTESVLTTQHFHASVQPEYDLPQQYRSKYQLIQRHREPAEQYQPDQQHQSIQRHREPVGQYNHDQQYQTTHRQQEPIPQDLPAKYYQSTPQEQVPLQQHVADQTSLPSDTQPQYEPDDLERGEESQWSTRTLVLNSSNAIPSADKPSTTQMAVTTTHVPVTTQEPDIVTEATVPTTEVAPLMLTAFPDVATTTETSTVYTSPFILLS
jgi:hypothetical protein